MTERFQLTEIFVRSFTNCLVFRPQSCPFWTLAGLFDRYLDSANLIRITSFRLSGLTSATGRPMCDLIVCFDRLPLKRLLSCLPSSASGRLLSLVCSLRLSLVFCFRLSAFGSSPLGRLIPRHQTKRKRVSKFLVDVIIVNDEIAEKSYETRAGESTIATYS